MRAFEPAISFGLPTMEYSPPPLFKQGPSARVRLVFFVFLSIALLFLDARFSAMEWVRKAVGTALYPFQQIAAMPARLVDQAESYFISLDALNAELDKLRKTQLADKQKLFELQILKAENQKLRRLGMVESVVKVNSTILAEIEADASDTFSKKIILSKGSLHGIKEGMPVIDELGLVGQVTRTFPGRSEVSLVTDKSQIVPVESLRNGIRSVAYGGGDSGRQELRFMAANSDIMEGDLLVTSGLDGVYPRGIPVSRVFHVEKNSRYAFASISCDPIAGVSQHRFVLVLDTTREMPSSGPRDGN